MLRFFKSILFFFLIGLVACTSGTSSDSSSEPASLITITDAFLKANSSHLTGTLTVYPESGTTSIAQVDLLFAEDGDGNLTVSSPAVNLKKSTVYRFVLIFYWDDLPYAYVDTTQAVGTNVTQQITFSESLIVYSVSSNPDVSASISEGVLPDLDSDGDGYSNFEELRADTNPNDPTSVPPGPAIVWENLTQGTSLNGTVGLNIRATDQDGVASLELINPANVADTSTLTSDTFAGNWDTTSLADGNFPLRARATDKLGNVSVSELIVNISNTVDRSGPSISINVYQISDEGKHEVDISNNEPVHDIIQILVRGTDATDVSSITLVNQTDFASTAIRTTTHANDYFLFDFDTTTFFPEGDITTELIFNSTDSKGHLSVKTLSLHVKNSPTISGLTINDTDILEVAPKTLTLSALRNIHISWDIDEFSERVTLQKGDACDKATIVLLLDQTEQLYEDDFSLSSGYGSGDYVFCSYRTTNNILGQPVTFISEIPITIVWDDDADGFKNEDDCGPLNKLSFPGSTRAYLMDNDYNCDGDNENINLGDATFSFTGDRVNDRAGKSLSYAGDVNGDGCSDILIGAAGKIYLIYGHGINCEYDSEPFGPDFELDDVGTVDLPGAVFNAEQPGDNAGQALQGVGQINDDTCDDFLIGAPNYDSLGKTDNGKIYLILGAGPACGRTAYSGIGYNLANVGSSIQGLIYVGERSGDNLGTAVSGLGDVNGDKKLDFGFSAPGYDSLEGILTHTDAGAIYITTAASTTIAYSVMNSERFGSTLSYAGRFNQDTKDDIAVGSPNYFLQGKLTIVPGASTLTNTPTTTFDYLLGQGLNSRFPDSIAPMGNPNSDVYDDIITGTANASVDLFHTGEIGFIKGVADSRIGQQDLLSGVYLRPIEGAQTKFGQVVSSGGNINAGLTNDLNDILIGAPGANSVFVWLDPNIAFSSLDADFTLLGESPGDNAGAQVSLYGGIKFDNEIIPNTTSPIPGDFNGDGCADPLISAPDYGGADKRGKVYLMLSGYCPSQAE